MAAQPATNWWSDPPKATKPRRPARDREHQEQKALFTWVASQVKTYPKLARLFAIPNGGARSKATAGKLKAEGVRKGVLDLCLPVARQGFHGLFIEMKPPALPDGTRAGQLSKEQRVELRELRADGYRAEVCIGWMAARDVLLNYLTREAP